MSTLTEGTETTAPAEGVVETTESPVETQATPKPEWMDWDPEDSDLLSSPALKVINSKDALLKSYIHSQRQIGADKIQIPGEYAAPEEWEKVWQKLGMPDLDSYSLNVAEDADDEFIQAFKEHAHKNGVLPKQAQQLYDWFSEYAGNVDAQHQEMQVARAQEELNKLREEKGKDWEPFIRSARLGLKAIGDDGFVEYLEESGLGDNPKVITAMAKLGEKLVEDKILGETSALGTTTEASQQFIDGVWSNPEHPAHHANHPLHKKAVRELQEHYANVNQA